jgi:hypothetical protein
MCMCGGGVIVKIRTDIHVWIHGGTNLTPKEHQWHTKTSVLGMGTS